VLRSLETKTIVFGAYIIFVKSGSIYVKLRPKWSPTHSTCRLLTSGSATLF